MEQYIRTNDDGERVVSYELLDVAARANMLHDVDLWADNIELDLDDPDFSDADGATVEIEHDTRQMLIDRLETALLKKYSLTPEF